MVCQGHGYMRGGYLLGGVGPCNVCDKERKREKRKCRALYSFQMKGVVKGKVGGWT